MDGGLLVRRQDECDIRILPGVVADIELLGDPLVLGIEQPVERVLSEREAAGRPG